MCKPSQKRKQQFITDFKTHILREFLVEEIWAHLMCSWICENQDIWIRDWEGILGEGNREKALVGILSLNTFTICYRLETLKKAKKKQQEFNRKQKSLLIREACDERERKKKVKSNYVNSLLCVCDKRKRRQDVWNKKEQEMKIQNVFSLLVLFLSFRVLSWRINMAREYNAVSSGQFTSKIVSICEWKETEFCIHISE